jgi:plasmid stabilization system protein ParE
MARIELAPGVFDDFGRVFDHTPKFGDPAAATQRIDEITKAVDVVTHSPLIGRKAKGGKRELVIGRALRGYVVLCRFLPDLDTVFVLALRSQRESDYRRGIYKGRRCSQRDDRTATVLRMKTRPA